MRFHHHSITLLVLSSILVALSPAAAQITLTIPDTSAAPGDIIQLPIYTTNLSGLGVGQLTWT